MSQKSQASRKASNQKSKLPFAIIALVLVAAAGAGWWMWRGTQARSNNVAASRSANMTGTAGKPGAASSTAPASTGATPAHTKGDAGAPVLIEEFADLQCPSCAVMHNDLTKILPEYGSRVRLVFRQYPLTTLHQNALAAALATESAARQGKFWQMQDHLYRNQPAWSTVADVRPVFYEYARAAGLDADRFMRDLRNPELLQRVQADMKRGEALGIQSTPTFIINNRMLPGDQTNPAGLRASVDAALRAAPAAAPHASADKPAGKSE